jgi:hypothetical protein
VICNYNMKELFYILVGILFFIFLFDIFGSSHCKNESFNDSNENNITNETDVADIIINFINENTTFKDYLELMSNTKNVYSNLLSPDTFYELKFLKRNDSLTRDHVMNKMTN